MDQIVPSIIFNMSIRTETSSPKSPTTISTDEIVVIMDDPSQLAEIVLKDLFYRTHLNNLSVCIQPVLTYEKTFVFLFTIENKTIPVQSFRRTFKMDTGRFPDIRLFNNYEFN